MSHLRALLVAALAFCAVASNPAYAQGGRVQPLGAISMIGPDGAVGETIRTLLLAPWQARHGAARYTPTASTAMALRSLAALREHEPADLVVLDPRGASQAYGRGLIVRLPRDSIAAYGWLLPIAREAYDPCMPIAFDALALTYAPETVEPPQGLRALATAPLRDRLALPQPTELIGAYLVGLLAAAETGDWRMTDAGLGRLQALRAGGPGLHATSPPAPAAHEAPTRLAVAWNAAAQRQRDAADPADRRGVVLPPEGTMLRPMLLCLSASAPNMRGALGMLERALAPDIQVGLAAALYLAPARDGVALPASLRVRLPDLADPEARLLLPDPLALTRLRGSASAQVPPPADAATEPLAN